MSPLVSRTIVYLILFVNVTQAGAFWRPPTRHLSQEELEPILQAWDEAVESGTFYDYNIALSSVTETTPKDVVVAGHYLGGTYFLPFSNPEIIERVIDYYFAVTADREANPSYHSYPRGGSDTQFTTHIEALADIAESTFDPQIYEVVLRDRGRIFSGFRNLYLAIVNPEKTLNFLFESKTGTLAPNAKEGNFDYFYHQGKTRWGMSVERAFTILSVMAKQSPNSLRIERERTLGFVARYAKHYAKPRKAALSVARSLNAHDYYLRFCAMDVVDLLGTADDAALVEQLIRDAREVDLAKMQQELAVFGRRLENPEQIRDIGLRMIDVLHRRSSSERQK
ncbi:MAG: hypothetical protein OXN17_10625 [Candidatus Poribacteria bacterium]|nr:hypothetical protein [Candidatus Poribacteria bacterium]MDE0506302.1 hypothetical protein [Candidatus Poribacteria bacterium]